MRTDDLVGLRTGRRVDSRHVVLMGVRENNYVYFKINRQKKDPLGTFRVCRSYFNVNQSAPGRDFPTSIHIRLWF